MFDIYLISNGAQEMGRPATPCKLGAKRVRSVRCRGGNMRHGGSGALRAKRRATRRWGSGIPGDLWEVSVQWGYPKNAGWIIDFIRENP